MIGEIVTHYRIVDKIGEGGMGVVYRAEDIRLGRQVAVKFISSWLVEDAVVVERFQREARAASSLNHPHICSVYDIGTHNGQPFLVMELLDGSTLRRKDGGSLPISLLLDYAAQVADGLDAAHSLGIVHRDIKSANIFVTSRGQIKILDFGLAKLTSGLESGDGESSSTTGTPVPQPTQTGQTLGTLTYMSPEQARGDDVDQRSDLFSFGVVLYEMATGREPFVGKTPVVVLDAILHHTPTRPSELNPRISPELDQVILKMLEKDRDYRYQSAAELRADLRRVRRDTDSERTILSQDAAGSSTTASAARSATTSGVTGAIGRRRFWTMAGALGVVLALAAGGAYALLGSSSTTIDSVAVLPFVVQGTAADTEYLTDGITETLINGLAQLPNLRVSARSVVFRYKGRDVDPQQVGRDLKVKAVVTGRVTIRGDRLVIQSELMQVDDGAQLWGGQYNRPQADLLVVQDEIAEEILGKVQPRLSGEERKRATRRYTDNAEAYQIYLQGRYHWNKGTIEGFKKSIDYFQQAIGKDPKYALAYAGLADADLSLGSYWVEAITEAKGAATEALALDPSLAEAHVALGRIKLWLDWDWAAADSEFKQGIALNPSSALAHDQYAVYLSMMGRVPEALTEVRRAQELDPLSPIVNSDLGWCLIAAGQWNDALAQFRKTLEFDPNSVSARRGLGIALTEAGQHAEAVRELTRALELSENSPVILGHLGAARARAGDRAAADAVLRQLSSLAAREYVPSSSIATVHAALGDKSRALDALEKAYEEHDFGIPQVPTAPWFQSLKDDVRFDRLVARLGIRK